MITIQIWCQTSEFCVIECSHHTWKCLKCGTEGGHDNVGTWIETSTIKHECTTTIGLA